MPTRYFNDGRGATLELEEVDGVLYPRYHDHLEQQLQCIRQLHLCDDDVILCTYPKAGTHWLWEVLTMLVNDTTSYCPDPKRSAMLEATDLDHLRSLNVPPSPGTDSPAPTQPPRVLNTHLLPRALPDMTWDSQCRLVVFHRNPKDTVVSLYNMAKQVRYSQIRSAFDGSFEGYASLFLDGTVPHGSWYDYIRAWEEVRAEISPHRLYLSSYEDMTRDPVGETRRLAEFLRTGTSDNLCQEIAQACSFHNLKEAAKSKRGIGATNFWKPNSTGIFRKGKVGDWKNWMTPDLSTAFDTAMTRLSDLDLHFTYEL